jgi:hypothetical protein
MTIARRAGAEDVRLVADTAAEIQGQRACVVHVAGVTDRTGRGWALFRNPFLDAKWRSNEYETSRREDAHAVWIPTVLCDIGVHHTRRDMIPGAQGTDTLSFVVYCQPQTPSDTPRVLAPKP